MRVLLVNYNRAWSLFYHLGERRVSCWWGGGRKKTYLKVNSGIHIAWIWLRNLHWFVKIIPISCRDMSCSNCFLFYPHKQAQMHAQADERRGTGLYVLSKFLHLTECRENFSNLSTPHSDSVNHRCFNYLVWESNAHNDIIHSKRFSRWSAINKYKGIIYI